MPGLCGPMAFIVTYNVLHTFANEYGDLRTCKKRSLGSQSSLLVSFWDLSSSRPKHSCVRFLPIKSKGRRVVTPKNRRITISNTFVGFQKVIKITLFVAAGILLVFVPAASAHRLDE